MNAGDTIVIPEPGASYDSHCWMVISDPTQGDECVIVNFTSWRADKDQACVVETGEHAYIVHKTLVNFKEAKRIPIHSLEILIASKHLKSHDRLSPELLNKIRAAVPQSRMNWECVELLADQSLIDLA
jgi:hypothetical protein